MRTNQLGRTGLFVSELCLGTMTFGGSGGMWGQITGQALRNLQVQRDNVVVATKTFGPTGPGLNSRGNSRAHLLSAVKASLRRL